MHSLLVAIFAANMILILVSLVVLPSEVAFHFGRDGIPNSWVSKEINALFLLALQLPLFFLFLFVSRLILRLPPKLVSLPNRDYWLKGENKARAQAILTALMWEYGFALFLFLFCVGLLTLEANLSDPVRLNETFFWFAFIAFMIYTGYWCVKMIRAFRVSKDPGPDNDETDLNFD